MVKKMNKVENEKPTLQDLEYGEKTENHGNEKYTIQDVKYGEGN